MTTTTQYETLILSAGVDSNHPLKGRYEFVLFDKDENIVLRETGFKSKSAAQRAGQLAAKPLLMNALF